MVKDTPLGVPTGDDAALASGRRAARGSLPVAAGLGSLLAAALVTGSAAVAQETQALMGAPLPGLTAQELGLFEAGLEAFTQTLTEADGVGPIFNEQNCVSCHNIPAVGGFGTRLVTRFGVAATATTPFQSLDNLGGSLLQDQSLDLNCREVVPPEANHTAERGTPICFGLGLIEAIPDSVILQRANNQPAGLSGRPHLVSLIEDPTGPMRPGKFGWKGGVATVTSFSLDAALNEMGLTSVALPNENAPNGNFALLALCDTVPDPEDTPDSSGFTFTDRLTHFQRLLAAPAQTPREGMTGEAVFNAIGCADCHVSRYVTGTVPEASLSGQTIQPYSDFLLHDMGALGDGIVEGDASEVEMFTRPLWGVRQRLALLHDGRATGNTFAGNIAAAVAEHGGEAQASSDAFAALTQVERDQVVAFLESLGRAEFDFDVNNEIDNADWFFLEPAVTGPAPAVPLTPDDLGAIADSDVDGDFDLIEFGRIQRVWTDE